MSCKFISDSNPSSPDEDPDIVPASQEELPPMARRPLDVLRFSPSKYNIFKYAQHICTACDSEHVSLAFFLYTRHQKVVGKVSICHFNQTIETR